MHSTGSCQEEFDKSRELEESIAENRLPHKNKEEGRSFLKGLFDKQKKPLSAIDILQMDAKNEDNYREFKKTQEEKEKAKDLIRGSYQAGPAETDLEKKEQEQQRDIATKVPWLVVATDGNLKNDTRRRLEEVGFKIGKSKWEGEVLFYEVDTPDGWTKATDNLWTEIKDKDGKVILKQFYKAAPHDQSAFLQFSSNQAEGQKKEMARNLPNDFDKRFGIFSKMKEDNPQMYQVTVGELGEMAFGGSVKGIHGEEYPKWVDDDFLELLKKLGETEEVKKVEDARGKSKYVRF